MLVESNWVQTVPGRAWFAYFRWYGPTQAYYDKSWALARHRARELSEVP